MRSCHLTFYLWISHVLHAHPNTIDMQKRVCDNAFDPPSPPIHSYTNTHMCLWTSYQLHKLVSHAPGIPGMFSPSPTSKVISDPGMHYGTCVPHVPWCMSGSLISVGGENVPGIPIAYTSRNFTYLARGPCIHTTELKTWFRVHWSCNVKPWIVSWRFHPNSRLLEAVCLIIEKV